MSDLEPFISTADLEAWLGESVDPSALATKIALDVPCHVIRSYLGQDINLVLDDVEIHSGSARKKLRLRERPVREVTRIVMDGEDVDMSTVSVRGHILTFTDGSVWWNGNDNIAVTYSHGYDIDETPEAGWEVERVPADIRIVALSVARRLYNDAGADITAGAIIEEKIGEYSYKLSDAALSSLTSPSQLVEGELTLLDPYKIELVGDTPTQP